MHLYSAIADMHSMLLYNRKYILFSKEGKYTGTVIYNLEPTVNVTANLQYSNVAIYRHWTHTVTRPSV